MTATVLHMWTLYDHPRDHPDAFVARRHIIVAGATAPTPDMFVADSLAELRALLPPGLVCVPRSALDEPSIVESWL